MKNSKIIFLFTGILVIMLSFNAYAGVIVFGNNNTATKDTVSEEKNDSQKTATEEKSATQETPVETNTNIPAIAQLAPDAKNIVLEGSRIGDAKISTSLTLTKKQTIINVETGGEDISFSIMCIEKGQERAVLTADSPSEAIGKTLLPGIYKVYPDLKNTSAISKKMKVTIHLGLSVSNINEATK